MWPSQEVGSAYSGTSAISSNNLKHGVCNSSGASNRKPGLSIPKALESHYLPLHQLAPNSGALDSYAPIIEIAPGAEHRSTGLGPYYGIIMLFALITIGNSNEDNRIRYEDIFFDNPIARR